LREDEVTRPPQLYLGPTHLLDTLGLANISAYALDPLSARGPRLEGIAEVLGLTGNLPVSELHDTHRVRRQAVVCKDEFSDPKVGSTEYAPHHKALLVRLCRHCEGS
jgi:hypothetical protein